MTTNGYLLNDKLFRQFYQAGITSYQITIDGWNHDKTRPHVSGKGTLQTIINNLASLSKLPPAEYSFHITLRHNILAVCLGMTNASPYLFVLLVTGVVKASTVYPSFIRIQKMCW